MRNTIVIMSNFVECWNHWKIAKEAVLRGDMKTYLKHIYPAVFPVLMDLLIVFIVLMGFRSFWILTGLEFIPAIGLAFLLKLIVSGVKISPIAKWINSVIGFADNKHMLNALLVVLFVADIWLCVQGYKAFYAVTGFSRANAAGILLFTKFLLGGIKFGK